MYTLFDNNQEKLLVIISDLCARLLESGEEVPEEALVILAQAKMIPTKIHSPVSQALPTLEQSPEDRKEKRELEDPEDSDRATKKIKKEQ
jgi:hypothetical protein